MAARVLAVDAPRDATLGEALCLEAAAFHDEDPDTQPWSHPAITP